MSRDRTARTRIREYLATSGPVVDPSGYATGILMEAIGYSGSSVAFIQLVAAMDREGEIERQIRGKRTYRITGIGVPETAHRPASAPFASSSSFTTVQVPGGPVVELDYQKLAQALVRELLLATAAATAVAPLPVAETGEPDGDRLAAERDEYARRLQIARSKIDELLGQPLNVELQGDDAVAGQKS